MSASCPAERSEKKRLATLVEIAQLVDKTQLNKVLCNFRTTGTL